MSVGLGPLGGRRVVPLVHANLWKGSAVNLDLLGSHGHLPPLLVMAHSEAQASGQDSGLDGPVEVVQGGHSHVAEKSSLRELRRGWRRRVLCVVHVSKIGRNIQPPNKYTNKFLPYAKAAAQRSSVLDVWSCTVPTHPVRRLSKRAVNGSQSTGREIRTSRSTSDCADKT